MGKRIGHSWKWTLNDRVMICMNHVFTIESKKERKKKVEDIVYNGNWVRESDILESELLTIRVMICMNHVFAIKFKKEREEKVEETVRVSGNWARHKTMRHFLSERASWIIAFPNKIILDWT